ncbi:hypothetical protein LTR37_005311 [Vermiconidia calcicola]|uniref:Uncharacterized protein n=1 Tax=Vermiconidia calcicola TaxID=1690605 RepID=A0ACC3NJJ7_9PEZI|nr:hypothetical protein LTR37_005311 [Vermiconidia calcicola]
MKFSLAYCAGILPFLSTLTGTHAVPYPIHQDQDHAEYEYIVVGSGPGGAPLAANLARAGHTVLLLEAGEDHGHSDLQRVPFFADANSEHPAMSWEFYVSHSLNSTQAQLDSKFTWRTPNGSLHVGHQDLPSGSEPLGIFYPRTGTLGGCSNHNAMNMVYPPDADWEFIVDLTGDEGFRAERMRELFVRLERNEFFPEGTAGHGFEGYLAIVLNDIDLVANQTGLLELIRLTMIEAGDASSDVTNEEVLDLLQRDQNRPDPDRYQQHSVFQIPVHIDAQRRRSSAQTYIYDVLTEQEASGSGNHTLTLRTNAFATRVLFEDNTKSAQPRATGVEYLSGVAMYSADRRYNASESGTLHTVHASREVIVAGGVFNTPQLLKLSGIGPRAELERFDIPVVVDLSAVGENMQDNYEAAIAVEGSRPFESPFEDCTPFEDGDPCLADWRYNASGAYGQGAATVGMIMRSSFSSNEDADLFFFGGAGGLFRGHYPGFSREEYPPNTFGWSVVKMQTRNRAGTVRLRSKDPRDVPEIAFNHFEQGGRQDIEAMAEGFEFARSVFELPGQEYGPFEYTIPAPGETAQRSIREEVYSHHAVGTCAMGADDDANACVNSGFQVRGVEGLRVVDGSVFPRVPGAFPVLPTFMMSEKATDDILAAVAEGL